MCLGNGYQNKIRTKGISSSSSLLLGASAATFDFVRKCLLGFDDIFRSIVDSSVPEHDVRLKRVPEFDANQWRSGFYISFSLVGQV